MRTLATLVWLAALAAGTASCSLGLDFGPEGQPCDSRLQCLSGFTCQQGVCVESASDAGTPRPDGGTGGTGCDVPSGCLPPAEAR